VHDAVLAIEAALCAQAGIDLVANPLPIVGIGDLLVGNPLVEQQVETS
jgi:hypothetical protein